MNKLQRLWLLTPILVAACKGAETGFTEPNLGPIAYVRYVHAMPDTGLVVVRWIDRVENWVGTPTSGTSLGVPYGTVTPFQGVAAGARTFRVWPATTDITLTQDEIATGTVTLSPDTYYTVLHTGYARCQGGSPAQSIVLIQETPPSPGAGQFSLRTIVAAPGLATAQDAYVTDAAGDPLPASPQWNALTYTQDPTALAAIPWVSVDTGTAVVRLYNDGTTATATLSSAVPTGARATVSSTNDLPGSRISGSGLTAFVFPQAQTGAACATSGSIRAIYGIDRRPPVPQP